MHRPSLLLRALPGLILAAHMALYGSWIVDDAGIVFAYARNWVEGFGLVAFPGEVPVEGFTSPLAVLLFAASMKLGLFDPVWTSKATGFVAMLGAIELLRGAARVSFPAAGRWIDVGLVLAAISPPLAVWTASGLENPLYALAVAALLRWTVRPDPPLPAGALFAGFLAGLILLVRPDGLVFAAIWPLAVLLGPGESRRRRFMLAMTASATTIACLALITLWRWANFGDVVPNTFHAKAGTMAGSLVFPAILTVGMLVASLVMAARVRLARRRWGVGLAAIIALIAWVFVLDGAPVALGGPLGPLVLGFVVASPVWADPRPARTVWLVTLLLGLFAYLAMPGDWMGEYRFATPFLLVGTVWATIEIGHGFASMDSGGARRAAMLTAIVAVTLLLGRQTVHALDYRARPALPFQTVEQHFRETFSSWNEELGLEDAEVLLPDVGGALWTRTVRVRDLVGLTDRRIARIPSESAEMRTYILEELRPEFIRIHGAWAIRSTLPGDPLFERDYVCVLESGDAGWGDFIRRDLVPDPSVLERWRAEN
jgi:hypothetical protein